MGQDVRDNFKRLKDVPVANKNLYKEVAARKGVSPQTVQDCVEIVGKFIADTIKHGAFEGIMVPYFGKFAAKQKSVQWMNDRNVMPVLPLPEPKQNKEG